MFNYNRMDKCWYVHKGILYCNENEWTMAICYNMDESHQHNDK